MATYKIDASHSDIIFKVKHLMITTVTGQFKSFDATLSADAEDFSDAVVTFTADINSVDTRSEQRDTHLKSDDFFNAEKFPTIKFESTSMQLVSGNKYKLNGNLTIRDVTKPVTFDVTYGGQLAGARGTKAGFKAITTINRFDYGLKWDRATETGGLVVGKDVEVSVKVELDEVK